MLNPPSPTVTGRIFMIFAARSPAKIHQARIGFVVVSMEALKAWWAWADKGFKDYGVDPLLASFASPLQAHRWVAQVIKARIQRLAAKCLRNTITPHNDSGQRPKRTTVADFVAVLKSIDGNPYLMSGHLTRLLHKVAWKC